MSTEGPKPKCSHPFRRRRWLVRLIFVLLSTALAFMYWKVQQIMAEIKILHFGQSSLGFSYRAYATQLDSFSKEVYDLKRQAAQKKAIEMQFEELILSQISARKEIEQLQLAVKAYPTLVEDLTAQYVSLKEANEELRHMIKLRNAEVLNEITEIRGMNLMARYVNMKEDNEELRDMIRSEQIRNTEILNEIHEIRGKLARAVDLETVRKEVESALEAMSRKELTKEIANLIQVTQEINQYQEEAEKGFNVLALDPFDVEESDTVTIVSPIDEIIEEIDTVTTVSLFDQIIEEKEGYAAGDVRVEESEDKSDIFMDDLDFVTINEQLKQALEERDRLFSKIQYLEASDPFNTSEDYNENDSEDDNDIQVEQKKPNVFTQKIVEDRPVINVMDPFDMSEAYSENDSEDDNDIQIEQKKPNVGTEEIVEIPNIANPMDPFYIEEGDDLFVTAPEYCEGTQDKCSSSESLFKDVSSWTERYSSKIKEILDSSISSTKKGLQVAKSFVKENGKEIANEVGAGVKKQAKNIAEKAKKLSKSVFALFNR